MKASGCWRGSLANGLRLVLVPMKGLKSVTAMMMVATGSRYETGRTRGIAHFLEHFVFKGTKKYPTARELAAVVDGVGAEFNAFTSKEYTGYFVKAESSQLERALDVLSQLIIEPKLPEEELAREKGVVIEEINMYEDQPMRKVGNVFEELLFEGTKLGWDVIGVKETVANLKYQDFLDYRERWYWPENMVLVIAGNFSGNQRVAELVGDYFGGLAKKQVRVKRERYQFVQSRPKVKLVSKKTEQAHLVLGVQGLKRGDRDRFALAVLSAILGANMSSRLFIEVRERRGLAYYVRSGTENYLDGGVFSIQAGVEIKRIDEAIKVILAELAKVCQNSGSGRISEKELKKGKDYLKGRLALDLEDSRDMAALYAEKLVVEGSVMTPSQLEKKVEAVRLEEIVRVAKRLLVEKHLNLAVIGPYKEEGKFERILRL